MNEYDKLANWLDDNFDIDSKVEVWRIIAALREEAGRQEVEKLTTPELCDLAIAKIEAIHPKVRELQVIDAKHFAGHIIDGNPELEPVAFEMCEIVERNHPIPPMPYVSFSCKGAYVIDALIEIRDANSTPGERAARKYADFYKEAQR